VIEVTLLNFVALKNPEKPRCFGVQAEDELTVKGMMIAESIEESSVEMVLINGKTADIGAALKDGDRVALSALITGG
jgi:hypothetical protein